MDEVAQAIWILLVLLIVASSLVARRVPMARLVTWSAGWIALFLGAYYLFGWIEPQITAWQQSRRGGTVAALPDAKPTVARRTSADISSNPSEGVVSIPMQSDGHFWVDATINGQNVRFLVDSGASITALSQSAADSLGLAPDPMNRTVIMSTANGDVTAGRSVIPAMRIGTIEAADLPVVVSASFGDVNVLGMNFLNKLKSWRVEDGTMLLESR